MNLVYRRKIGSEERRMLRLVDDPPSESRAGVGIEQALRLYDLGLSVIPLQYGKKKPPKGFRKLPSSVDTRR